MCIPSNSSAFVNPVSISFCACSGVFAIAVLNSSFEYWNIEASMLMYFMVDLISLCPKIC